MPLQIKRYQIDAFAESVFQGNPAVVCPLESWLPDGVMQNIAMENNLSETAFYVKENEAYQIRWFTPEAEVDLCGHATLAAAFVLFNNEGHIGQIVSFKSRSGMLRVSKVNEMLSLDFPTDSFAPVSITPELTSIFSETVNYILKGKTDYLFVFESEAEVKNCKPDFLKITKLDARGVIITAAGSNVDFVSRFFGPKAGVNEDPVTGSAHTTLTPYWASVLGKTKLKAAQLSARGGKLECELRGERVMISGTARLFSTGLIYLD